MSYKPLFAQPANNNTAIAEQPQKTGGYVPLFAQSANTKINTQPVQKTTGYIPLFSGKENKLTATIPALPNSPANKRAQESKDLINGMIKSGQATTAPLTSIAPKETIAQKFTGFVSSLFGKKPENKPMEFKVGEGLNKESIVNPGPRISTLEAIKAGDKVSVVPVGQDTKLSPNAVANINIKNQPETPIPFTLKSLAPLVQFPQRALTSVGLEMPAAILSLIKNKTVEAKYQPTGALERMLLGDEPIKGMFAEEKEAEAAIKPFLTSRLKINNNSAQGMALALAPLFVGSMKALDLTPFGGEEKNMARLLARTTDAVEASKILRRAGVGEDIIKEYAPRFVEIKTATEAQKGLESLKNLIQTSAASKGLPELPKLKIIEPAISKERQSLAQEAAKYKSPEEFVKKTGAIGEINYRDFSNYADLAGSSKTAKEFQDNFVKENLKSSFKMPEQVIVNEFQKRTGMTFEEFFNNVKADINGGMDKSQLTDIFNKAKNSEITFDNIKTKPELFQQTRSLEKLQGAGFEEYKVGEVLKDFNEKRLLNNPITVGDINGELVVTSGHNRLEILKRAKATGLLTKPDSAYIKVVKFKSLDDAIKESIESNIRSKSVKDINAIDLLVKNKITEPQFKNALAYDETKIKYLKEVADTFKNNNLQDFWGKTVGRELSTLKGLDFGVMQEKLNFVNQTAKQMNKALKNFTPEQAQAVKDTMADKIAEVLRSGQRSLKGVGDSINRYLQTIETGGFDTKQLVNLFGETVSKTEVAAKSKAQVLINLINRNLKSTLISAEQRTKLQNLFKLILEKDPGAIDYINKNSGQMIGSQKTRNVFNKLLGMTSKDIKKESVISDLITTAKQEKKALVIDPDYFKKVFNDYADATHPEYSNMAKETYERALKEIDNPTVKFTAGGPGSAKSEILINEIKKNFDGIIYDGVIDDFGSFKIKYNKAIEAGKNVEIYPIVVDPKRAWKFAQYREIITERPVPLPKFAEMHVNFIETIKKIVNEKLPKVKIFLKDSRGIYKKSDIINSPFITDSAKQLDILKNIRYNKNELERNLSYVELSERAKRKAQSKREEIRRNQSSDRIRNTGGVSPVRRTDEQLNQPIKTGEVKPANEAGFNIGENAANQEAKDQAKIEETLRKKGLKESYIKMRNMQELKGIDNIQLKRVREKFGTTEWKNTTKAQLDDIYKELAGIEKGDKYLTADQSKVLMQYDKSLTPDRAIMTGKEAYKKYGFVVPPSVKGDIHAPILNFEDWNDKSAFILGRETLERNIERVAGEDANKVKDFIVKSTRINETNRVEFLNNQRTLMRDTFVKKMGIRVGTVYDKLVQRFGEERMVQQELWNQTDKILNKYNLKKYKSDLSYLLQVNESGGSIKEEIKNLKLPELIKNKIELAVKDIGKIHGDLMAKGELGLLKEAAPKNWQNIQKATEYFREIYHDLLERVNEVRKKFDYEAIPERKNYFRHFIDMQSEINKFGRIFEKEDLPTEISGLTEFFNPGKPFSTAELKRKGLFTTESAIKGMDNYLDTISKQIYHIDSVQRGRALEKYIRKASEFLNQKKEMVHLPEFVKNVHEYTNLLSGKKAQLDRVLEGYIGRFFPALNWIKQRTSTNMILGNVSSALTNFIPFTQSLATTGKKYFSKGLFESATGAFNKNIFDIDGVESSFLKRRYPINNIDLTRISNWTGLGNAKAVAGWLFETIDKFTSKAIVSAKYFENLALGMKQSEAIREADIYAGKLLADRSLGQLPNLMNTKTFAPITQFQTEVNNAYSFLTKDIPKLAQGQKVKLVSMIGQFIVYSYLFNSLYEKVNGRRPTLDIGYAITYMLGLEEESQNKSFMERAAYEAKDISGNLPFIGSLAGGRFPISAGLPSIKPADYASGKWKSELAKPVAYLLPPFGGGQAKKTIEGLNSYSRGEVRSKSGKTKQFNIKQNPANLIRAGLFGKYATPEASNYFNGVKNNMIDGLPKLPKLPSLPKLPKLPKI